MPQGKIKTEAIEREYCAWEGVAEAEHKPGSRLFLRGDLRGELTCNPEKKVFHGIFEFPAKGGEEGWYEVVCRQGGRDETLRRVTVDYTFDSRYYSPRWENVDGINRFLARHYSAFVRLETIHHYEKFDREMQLLVVTDPAVDDSQKQLVLISGRVHNPESGMTTACYRFISWLLQGEGGHYLEKYVFLIVPMTLPLTFDEDPRGHNVNRLWLPEMTAPDLVAFRDRILDRYIPEVWIDCHSFNEELPLHDPAEERKRCGDYIVAHPVGEKSFDAGYSTEIGLRMIAAAEQAGHRHRNEAFFRSWAEAMPLRVPSKPGEKFVTEHHPAGIFSGRDYARFADRGKFGIHGRDWPAMACDYGYHHCHAINICLECKPLHVNDSEGNILHYPASFPDSQVVKLRELCRIGQEAFAGQPCDGFPCNIIAADEDPAGGEPVMLCAWGGNKGEIRESRNMLWKNRHSICLRRSPRTGEINLQCFSHIRCQAALRFTRPQGGLVQVNGASLKQVVRGPCVFVPLTFQPGETWSFR